MSPDGGDGPNYNPLIRINYTGSAPGTISMAARQGDSVPFPSEPRPQEVLKNGTRLDGRGHEEFRNVCKWAATACKHAWLAGCPLAGRSAFERGLVGVLYPSAAPVLQSCRRE